MIYSRLLPSLLCIFSAIEVQAQVLPIQALAGEPLNTNVQLEGNGPSLWAERSGEVATHTRAEIFVPIAQSDVDAYAIQLRGHRLFLDRDRPVPGTSIPIPQDLGSASLGVFAKHVFVSESGEKNVVVGDVALGRSGTQIGRGETATTVSSTIFLARPRDSEGGQWIYILSYSNARSTFNGIPVPGFAYSKPFQAGSGAGLWVAGVPFFFGFYRGGGWSTTALLTPFTSFADVGYSVFGPASAFVRFGWTPQSFRITGGPEERIIYEEFRTQLGLRSPVARWLMASVGIMYSDGRRVVWGDSLIRASNASAPLETRLDDEASAFFNLSARF